MNDKLPGKKWVAAQHVAQAVKAKRDAIAGSAKNIDRFSIAEFVRVCTEHDTRISVALDEWIRAGGE